MEWQPIETAPKDGTSILLIIPRGMCEEVPPVYVGAYHDQWFTYGASCSGSSRRSEPTHWMPLPDLPETPHT